MASKLIIDPPLHTLKQTQSLGNHRFLKLRHLRKSYVNVSPYFRQEPSEQIQSVGAQDSMAGSTSQLHVQEIDEVRKFSRQWPLLFRPLQGRFAVQAKHPRHAEALGFKLELPILRDVGVQCGMRLNKHNLPARGELQQ